MIDSIKFCGKGHGIVLDRMEAYDASVLNCCAFRRGTDMIDGKSVALGNMVSGYPFKIDEVFFYSSESAYIAGMFSDSFLEHKNLQIELANETNGFMAKKRIRRQNRHLARTDWEEFNIDWMLYVVWSKVKGNEDFKKILMDLPDDSVIIEDSTFQAGRTSSVWGTKNKEQRKFTNDYKRKLKEEGLSKKAIKDKCDEKRLGEWRKTGVFEGKNLMGKILMLCREALKNGGIPPIDFDLLKSKNIHLLGKKLTFENY